jgi:glycosyltransferase involved in cell wall biosynthesis
VKITVCIATVRAATLPSAIESIRRQTWQDWELIIVGQGDAARLRALGEAAARSDPRIRYVHLHERGVSRARNAGIALATGRVVATTDDDCEAREDWLEVIAREFTSDPDLGVLGGALLAPRPPRLRLSACPALEPLETLYEPGEERGAPRGWDWIGANVAIRRGVLERAGPFDEHLGPGAPLMAGEDTDYKLRLEALGVRMRCTPRSVVFHTHGRRYGLRAIVRFAQSYATGNGALAAKLTLLSDPRGRQWVDLTQRAVMRDLTRFRLHRALPGLVRLFFYRRSYAKVLAEYDVEVGRPLLRPRAQNAYRERTAVRRSAD